MYRLGAELVNWFIVEDQGKLTLLDAGSCVHLPDRDVVFTGDSLVTLNIPTGERGARVMPGSFNKDSALALNSLGQFSGADARTVLPGHGEPWFDGIGDAVTEALRVGGS